MQQSEVGSGQIVMLNRFAEFANPVKCGDSELIVLW